MPGSPLSPDSSIIAFVLITVIYLVLTGMTLFVARPSFKVLGAGLLTAVAATGYAGLVGGGAALVAPTLMKIAFLLVLIAGASHLLDRPPPPPPPPHHSHPSDRSEVSDV